MCPVHLILYKAPTLAVTPETWTLILNFPFNILSKNIMLGTQVPSAVPPTKHFIAHHLICPSPVLQIESTTLPVQTKTWNTKRVTESVYGAVRTQTQFSCLQLWELFLCIVLF